jgi:hypothetical protein
VEVVEDLSRKVEEEETMAMKPSRPPKKVI